MPKANKPKSRPQSASRPRSKPAPKANQYPDQDPDIRKELESVLSGMVDPERWLNTPNSVFYLKKPIEMIGTEDEDTLRQWIGAVKYGLMT